MGPDEGLHRVQRVPLPERVAAAERPPRVLILIDHLGVGGAQEFLFDLCVRLRSEGVDAAVCGLEGGPYEDRLRTAGVPVEALMPIGSIAATPRVVPSLIRAASRFGRCLSRRQPDVVHTFLQASLATGTPLARL